ncbi:ubiE/COQ5 methyltransferase [Punctularia strigosozonata HHB-11173 SS5]|uniref:ubiE/COQ5 methyltransferase n=1 Tax=Punctularia strigosozonata (strain HHB-11173) TaxID=741275 RepID=UPI00044165F9|nr:ubiE/COQ5 methyltransferase [Punctularia strigosozonata HHB-11173 SS5]EIN11735.1 ubiE/COQ5 methyltransferase [Punctularia strigosozonata HHB-11173 SS5]
MPTDSSRIYVSDHSAAPIRTHSWRTVANSAAYLVPYLKPNLRILDVGCGPGTITVDFARHVPQGHVIGLEYFPDPLDGARALAVQEGVKNVEFTTGDVHALQYPDDSFDIVHAHQVLQHIRDPVQALREMKRVTRPGGLVAVRESARFFWYPLVPAFGEWKNLYDRIAKARGGNPDPGNQVHVWAREAGFDRSSIKCSVGAWCFSTPEERDWFGNMWADRTVGTTYADIAVGDGYCTQEELERFAAAFREWIQNEDGWFSIVHGEIVCKKE